LPARQKSPGAFLIRAIGNQRALFIMNNFI
jgi:hypothetical protein